MARTGRPRTFDEAVAVDAAQELFWRDGYSATSVDQLTRATGLERGSLYNTFGDKHALYIRALHAYRIRQQERLDLALQAEPLLPALRDLLAAGAFPSPAAPEARGCMTGNAIAESVPRDDDARQVTREACQGFIDAVSAALRRAQTQGEVSPTVDPEVQAALLLALTQGTTLVARTGVSTASLATAIDTAINALAANRDAVELAQE